jgi:hypothetical protein
MAVARPMAAYPHGMRVGAHDISPADPDPGAVPGPVAGSPDVIGAWRNRHDFNPRRRRSGGHQEDLRRRSGRRRRRGRLGRNRSRSGGRSLPIGGTSWGCGGWRGNRHPWRWVRLLRHVNRRSAIHGDILDPALSTTSDQGGGTRERKARGQSSHIHKSKSLHILPIRPDGRAGYSGRLTINLAGSCNRMGLPAVSWAGPEAISQPGDPAQYANGAQKRGVTAGLGALCRH